MRYDLTGDSADLVGPGQFNNRSNQYNVDGGNMDDVTTVGRTALGASVEEVKEFQVLTNNYNAEYGQAGGLILNVVTKSGTNSIHGDFHIVFPWHEHGGSPILHQVERRRLSRLLTSSTRPDSRLADPSSRTRPFGSSALRRSRREFPCLYRLRLHQTVTQGDDELLWSAKIDHQINSKNHFTGQVQRPARLRQSNLLVQTPAATFQVDWSAIVGHDHTMNLGVTSTLTPHLVNEARVFWHRFLGHRRRTNSGQPGQQTSHAY